ncbi:sulfate transporter CysZ [Allochromatium palmeri]|uniref:Sulfate transporter CysZ n=1 Tax=Allochromatium palmeri TaxID=231048 RepID=A0A6N8E7M8_9GAMM|nr:sulfate transporter CysZ [Allochromatium palmeri]MTW20155.1 sulfate transporter CysZ [Allochromatium palmeri]
MLSHSISGAGYLLQGLRLITRPGIKRFVAIPLLLNMLVFSAAIYVGVQQFEALMGFMDSKLPSWLDWLDWLLWPLFILFLLVVVFQTFGLLANLIAAPFNGLLAEKVELMLTGRPIEQDGDYDRLLAELGPTLLDESRKLAYALLWAIPFLVLLFVPVVGTVLWFLYTAWMLAVEYSDYPMGNHGLRFGEIRRRLRERRALSLSFGAAAAGMAMVPVLNFLLMPSAVAGATAMWVREFRPANGYQGSHQSRVATHYVLLTIDHLSGRMNGEILAGPLTGRTLDAAETAELLDLLNLCYRTDAESAEALEAYLTHERGQRFQEPPPRPDAGRAPPPSPDRPGLDENEARAILGLAPEAGADDIQAAHRRLIQRLHPDRGGSDYLAAKVNEAKRVLLSPRS